MLPHEKACKAPGTRPPTKSAIAFYRESGCLISIKATHRPLKHTSRPPAVKSRKNPAKHPQKPPIFIRLIFAAAFSKGFLLSISSKHFQTHFRFAKNAFVRLAR
jgi:hypothetical protein